MKPENEIAYLEAVEVSVDRYAYPVDETWYTISHEELDRARTDGEYLWMLKHGPDALQETIDMPTWWSPGNMIRHENGVAITADLETGEETPALFSEPA
ncbi:MAG: hypothetical protein KGL39_22105 [Patescibacteria group bacterium]|nr:hypothetical protein [Patescibacteria group bacterium]